MPQTPQAAPCPAPKPRELETEKFKLFEGPFQVATASDSRFVFFSVFTELALHANPLCVCHVCLKDFGPERFWARLQKPFSSRLAGAKEAWSGPKTCFENFRTDVSLRMNAFSVQVEGGKHRHEEGAGRRMGTIQEVKMHKEQSTRKVNTISGTTLNGWCWLLSLLWWLRWWCFRYFVVVFRETARVMSAAVGANQPALRTLFWVCDWC